MRRVAITGIGIVCSIGNNKQEVLQSLKLGSSGITVAPEYAEIGMRSQIHGSVKLDVSDHLDKKNLRFMGTGAAYNAIAMDQAIKDASLTEAMVSNERTGLIMGSGGPSTRNLLEACDNARQKGAKRVGPFMVPRTMSSTNSATLAIPFKIKGINYSISSACSTSAHCIGSAAEQIQWGKQDIVFAGGGEELDWSMSVLFDGMQALSSNYNATPEKASRPYDSKRDGFVIAGGGGVLVMEEWEHAIKRGAKIYAELVGYGANSDGFDMVQPSGEGAVRCMNIAMQNLSPEDKINYINAHGTSTPVGDSREANAIKQTFDGKQMPFVTSTKSMSGHSLGAAGVHEAIYTLLMMEHNFIAPSINIETLDEECGVIPIVQTLQENVNIRHAMSNSFGFGGTNCSLVFKSSDH